MHDRRARLLNLTALVVALSVPVGLLDGPVWWVGVGVLMAATAIAARTSTDRSWHGLPLAPAVLPVLAAFSTAGLAHLAGDGALWVLALACGGALVALTLLAEARLAGPADDRRARLERQVVPLSIVVAFAAFLAAAGAIAGGLADASAQPTETAFGGLTVSGVLLLALADAAVAAALGYRLAALRTTNLERGAAHRRHVCRGHRPGCGAAARPGATAVVRAGRPGRCLLPLERLPRRLGGAAPDVGVAAGIRAAGGRPGTCGRVEPATPLTGLEGLSGRV